MTRSQILFALVPSAICGLVNAVAADDEIKVEVIHKSAPPCDGSVTILFFDKDTDFTINIAPCTDIVKIYAAETTADSVGIARRSSDRRQAD